MFNTVVSGTASNMVPNTVIQATPGSALRLIPVITLALMLGPVFAGLVGTILPAFGYLPALGGGQFGLAIFQELLAVPGLGRSVWLSLFTGVTATIVSFLLVVLFCAAWYGTTWFRWLERLLSPLLSAPHVAVAIGFAFLIAPSGWVMRVFSPGLTGYTQPPDITIIHDPYGVSLMLGLILKEVPFLLLMTIAALGQVDARRTQRVALSLGYGRMMAWLTGVLPQIYPQIRLPILAVLAFSLSVVDVALVLAPTTPPPLAVQLLRWMNDADLSLRFLASAGAVLQLGLVVLAILLWLVGERIIAAIATLIVTSGWRFQGDASARVMVLITVVIMVSAVFLGVLGMAIWSFAGFWRFPMALPDQLVLRNWMRLGADLWSIIGLTALVASLASAFAVVLSVLCLENEAQQLWRHRRGGRLPQPKPWRPPIMWLLYLPLLVPQVAFLFGVQVLLILLALDGQFMSLVWAHLVFVLPYVFLSLGDAYRRFDDRYIRTSLCLGRGPVITWLVIKLPMLLRPILIAMAVGFAVSIGLFLPTILIGGGRFDTLTTEAVALSAGGDRRQIGVFTQLQLILPLLAFSVAMALPALLFRHRRGVQV
ncbi:MAG: ABC transporter permease [Pseudomonadota bacterium]